MGVKWFALFFLAFSFLAIGWVMWTPKMETVNEKIDIPKICKAIYRTEGGNHAKYLYGIRSVHYRDKAEAREICLRSIAHRQREYKEFGYRLYPCFIEYLQSKYCPATRRNPMQGERWIKNVTYFYYKQGG